MTIGTQRLIAFRGRLRRPLRELEEVPMPIVGGLDIHRKQLTFDYLDTVSGQVTRGQVAPADREHLRAWLARVARRDDDAAFAMEACTVGGTPLPGWPRRDRACTCPSRPTRPSPAAASGTPRPTRP